jgi:hypothetical protein
MDALRFAAANRRARAPHAAGWHAPGDIATELKTPRTFVECRAAAGEGVDIEAWTQLTNSWLGIARMLDLERRQKPIWRLHEHLNGTALNA